MPEKTIKELGYHGMLRNYHPAVTFLFTLFLIICAGFANGLYILALLAGTAAGLSAILKINPVKTMRPFRFLLLFSFMLQLFVHERSWEMPDIHSFEHAGLMTLRMGLIIAFSSFYAFVAAPLDIVRIFYYLFRPLRFMGISPEDLALSMVVAVRFIPLMFSEGEKIMDSQVLKGVLPSGNEKRGLLKTISSVQSLIIPLFIRTLNYAMQIAVTLRYRDNGKRFLKLAALGLNDYKALTLLVILAAGAVFIGY